MVNTVNCSNDQLKDHFRIEWPEDCESWRLGRTRGKQYALDMSGFLNSEIHSISGYLHKTWSTSSIHCEGPHEFPFLIIEPWMVKGFRRRDSQFSLRLWVLVGGPHSSRWSYTHEYIEQHNMDQLGY